MSRMHDALENARALVPATAAKGRAIAEPPRLPGGAAASDLPLLRLWQAVGVRLPDKPCRVIQIAPCGEAEQDPAVAVRLARLAGRSMGGGVLLLNSVESETRMDDGGEVALGPLPGRAGDARALNPRLLEAYWQRLAEQAELIILDAPPCCRRPWPRRWPPRWTVSSWWWRPTAPARPRPWRPSRPCRRAAPTSWAWC
ncbi:MAG: hypothetical protein NVV74_23135 [Magnetospirillum sp.]|nr:hypothetical protein [Magnetospirillum sp.]